MESTNTARERKKARKRLCSGTTTEAISISAIIKLDFVISLRGSLRLLLSCWLFQAAWLSRVQFVGACSFSLRLFLSQSPSSRASIRHHQHNHHHWLHSLIHPFHGTFCLRLSPSVHSNTHTQARLGVLSLTGSFIQKGHNL